MIAALIISIPFALYGIWAFAEKIVDSKLDGSLKRYSTTDKIFNRYINAEKELSSMLAFIRENAKDCEDREKLPPKEIIIRYGISHEWRSNGLAWYLLDEYFKGNVTIKK